MKRQAEFLQKDCEPEYIENFYGLNENGLSKASRDNEKRAEEKKNYIGELEKKFTRERAKADFNSFETQKSIIWGEKSSLKETTGTG